MLFDATVDGRTRRVEVRPGAGGYSLWLDGRALDLDVVETADGFTSVLIAGRSYEVAIAKQVAGFRVHFPEASLDVELKDAATAAAAPAPRASGPSRLTAPMPGRIVGVLVAAGDEVAAGQGLIVVEAMKMQNELRAPRGGRVLELAVREGQSVEAGALLVVIA